MLLSEFIVHIPKKGKNLCDEIDFYPDLRTSCNIALFPCRSENFWPARYGVELLYNQRRAISGDVLRVERFGTAFNFRFVTAVVVSAVVFSLHGFGLMISGI